VDRLASAFVGVAVCVSEREGVSVLGCERACVRECVCGVVNCWLLSSVAFLVLLLKLSVVFSLFLVDLLSILILNGHSSLIFLLHRDTVWLRFAHPLTPLLIHFLSFFHSSLSTLCLYTLLLFLEPPISCRSRHSPFNICVATSPSSPSSYYF
jgi:hypothetical protein